MKSDAPPRAHDERQGSLQRFNAANLMYISTNVCMRDAWRDSLGMIEGEGVAGAGAQNRTDQAQV